MNQIIFFVTFIAIANWTQIIFFVLALLHPKVRKTKIKDKWMLDTVKNKAGFALKEIVAIESDKMYGGMTGVPGSPLMMLSSKLLKTLNKDEQEYVLLHEAGHFKYHHPIILALSQILLIAIGIYLSAHGNPLMSLFLGSVLSLVLIHIARVTEAAAENFAASHMDNPKAMLTAVSKFNDRWEKSPLKPIRPLGWNIPYEKKCMIAKRYI